MKLLDRLKNNTKSENASEATGWENMDVQNGQTENLANINRQKAKLIQALLPGNGNPDMEAFWGEPRTAGLHDEEIVLAKMSMGQIGRRDFEVVLDNIKGPLEDKQGILDFDSANRALEKMQTNKQQLKMLAFANDYPVDLHYGSTGIADVAKVTGAYKNPIVFEEKMAPFMAFLAEHNSPQKVAEYEVSLRNLEKNLFGKKYEYYERIKELQGESERFFGKPDNNATQELERNYERLVKTESTYQISRAQARQGMRAEMGQNLPYDQSCEDSSFIDHDNGFFGVFDGAGGHEGGRRASNIGVRTLAELMNQHGTPKTPNDLSDWLDEASARIANDPAAGYSTGTLAKVIKRQDGGKAVIYAQVGDSRLYIVHPNGNADLVTNDEGYEKTITNALGIAGKDKVCVQAGYRELNEGDKLVLCSDGITGDVGAEKMSREELAQTVLNAGNTAYAAQALVHQARKNDDRTAIVVEV